MRYRVEHTTQYEYDAEVTASYAELRQLPGDIDGQRCVERSITTVPAADHLSEHSDYFGNITTTVSIYESHTRLVVTSSSVVDTSSRRTDFDDDARRPWQTYCSSNASAGDLAAVEFSMDSALVTRSDELAEYARPSFGDTTSLADGVASLCARIYADFEFDPKATEVTTPLVEVLQIRKGVCQDFAHVMVGALRSVGLAACYVSGYLETLPPPGQARLTGADRTHAWVGVYLGDDRWVGVDPTNNQLAGPRYVTAAHGRDYRDVPPLKGVIFTDAKKSVLTVSVDVEPQPTT